MQVHRSPMHRSIPFPTTPAVPSVGFGFNLLHQASTSATPPPRSAPPTPSRQATSNKRRHEFDAEQEDENMTGRSPSPTERPKKALAKRVRVEPQKGPAPPPGGKPVPEPADSMDVGLMLASLPPASHLTILTSLITKHPGLKSIIIPLIPRPTLDAAVQAINAAAKKIRDAHPYSQPPPSIGFGFGFGSPQLPGPGLSSFGSAVSSPNSTSSTSSAGGSSSGIRDGYVQNRLRPVVAEFASTARSYLSYFTSETSPTPSSSSSSSSAPAVSSNPIAELVHPADTFTYLHTLTLHILRLSPQARGLIVKEHDALLVRVQSEWRAWLDRIDAHVNRSAGMYGSETVRIWERGLDELVALEAEMPPLSTLLASEGENGAEGSRTHLPTSLSSSSRPQSRTYNHSRAQPTRSQQQQQVHQAERPMRTLRDTWVTKVGWLISRRAAPPPDQYNMDEDDI